MVSALPIVSIATEYVEEDDEIQLRKNVLVERKSNKRPLEDAADGAVVEDEVKGRCIDSKPKKRKKPRKSRFAKPRKKPRRETSDHQQDSSGRAATKDNGKLECHRSLEKDKDGCQRSENEQRTPEDDNGLKPAKSFKDEKREKPAIAQKTKKKPAKRRRRRKFQCSSDEGDDSRDQDFEPDVQSSSDDSSGDEGREMAETDALDVDDRLSDMIRVLNDDSSEEDTEDDDDENQLISSACTPDSNRRRHQPVSVDNASSSTTGKFMLLSNDDQTLASGEAGASAPLITRPCLLKNPKNGNTRVDLEIARSASDQDLFAPRPARASKVKAAMKIVEKEFSREEMTDNTIPAMNEHQLIDECATRSLKIKLRDLKFEMDPSIAAQFQEALAHRHVPEFASNIDVNLANKEPQTDYRSVPFLKLLHALRAMYSEGGHVNPLEDVGDKSAYMICAFINEHRKKCKTCNKTLHEMDIGHFSNLGTVCQMESGSVSPLNTVDTTKESGHLQRIEKDALIEEMYRGQLKNKNIELAKARERVKSLSKTVTKMHNMQKAGDSYDTMDLVDMLKGVQLPTQHHTSSTDEYVYANGFRLIDLKILRTALSNSQVCHHNKLNLVEHTTPDAKADLATKLAFVCAECGPRVSFPSSALSQIHPENYTINKTLLPRLGPTAYYKLVEFVNESNSNTFFYKSQLKSVAPGLDTLMVSYDKSIYDFRRPHELHTYAKKHNAAGNDGNIVDSSLVPSNDSNEANANNLRLEKTEDPKFNVKKDTSSSNLCLKPLASLMAAPSSKKEPKKSQSEAMAQADFDVFLPTADVAPSPGQTLDLQPMANLTKTVGQSSTTAVASVSTVSGGGGAGGGPRPAPTAAPPVASAGSEQRIKASAELPPGCRITAIPAGTKVISRNIMHSTTSKTTLNVGVYKVVHPKFPDRVLVVRDDNGNNSASPCHFINENPPPPRQSTSNEAAVSGMGLSHPTSTSGTAPPAAITIPTMQQGPIAVRMGLSHPTSTSGTAPPAAITIPTMQQGPISVNRVPGAPAVLSGMLRPGGNVQLVSSGGGGSAIRPNVPVPNLGRVNIPTVGGTRIIFRSTPPPHQQQGVSVAVSSPLPGIVRAPNGAIQVSNIVGSQVVIRGPAPSNSSAQVTNTVGLQAIPKMISARPPPVAVAAAAATVNTGGGPVITSVASIPPVPPHVILSSRPLPTTP